MASKADVCSEPGQIKGSSHWAFHRRTRRSQMPWALVAAKVSTPSKSYGRG